MNTSLCDFDANATTAMSPAAVEAFLAAAGERYGNPSSAHGLGAAARRRVSSCRETVAGRLGVADPDSLFFVSGGTEANNIVINGFSRLPSARVLYSAVEHPSVGGPAEAAGGLRIEVNRSGTLDPGAVGEAAAGAARAGGAVLVSVQSANSETGVIQPIRAIAEACGGLERVFLHVDAAQAIGRVELPLEGLDAVTMSGHKLHAPPGSGLLYLSDRLFDILPRAVLGGGQERSVRPGTHNLPAIAGLAAALDERFRDFDACVGRLRELRDGFERGVTRRIPSVRVVGVESERTPNTSNLLFPGVEAMALLARLDARGIACSTGSACSSMKPSPSHVLVAMGLSEREAFSCLRFSFSVMNAAEQVARAVDAVAEEYENLRNANDR